LVDDRGPPTDGEAADGDGGLMADYWKSDMFRGDVLAAKAKFEMVNWWQNADVIVGEAQAGTGSRYLAVATRLPGTSHRAFGAPVLVSLLSPWEAAYPMWGDSHGHLHARYVGEKLGGRKWQDRVLHGGDWCALTLLVGRLLERPVDPAADLLGAVSA
jgi:hypothetical protein